MDDFEIYTIDIDSECLLQDFDDIDLYGEKIEENNDNFGEELQLE